MPTTRVSNQLCFRVRLKLAEINEMKVAEIGLNENRSAYTEASQFICVYVKMKTNRSGFQYQPA
jgi:hypothetical protein